MSPPGFSYLLRSGGPVVKSEVRAPGCMGARGIVYCPARTRPSTYLSPVYDQRESNDRETQHQRRTPRRQDDVTCIVLYSWSSSGPQTGKGENAERRGRSSILPETRVRRDDDSHGEIQLRDLSRPRGASPPCDVVFGATPLARGKGPGGQPRSPRKGCKINACARFHYREHVVAANTIITCARLTVLELS